MTDYITFNITNGKVNKIKCADTSCPAEYTREYIRKFGSQEIFEKYLKFKENIDVNTNRNLKWCTRPDCNRFVIKEKATVLIVNAAMKYVSSVVKLGTVESVTQM